MTDDPKSSEDCATDHVTETKTSKRHKNGHVIRKVVRNMVTNMEYVLNDIQGIMGDIKTLVVQIDSVTDKIDAQCKKENHVVRKPQMIDCQTYWSRTMSKNHYKEMKEKTKQAGNVSSEGYEIPVFPSSLSACQSLPGQKLDSPNKLSNVERWLVQENAHHYQRYLQHSKSKSSAKRFHHKSVRFSDKQYYPRSQPLTYNDTKHSKSAYIPHTVRQPCAHIGEAPKANFSKVEDNLVTQNATAGYDVEPEYCNIKYEAITNCVGVSSFQDIPIEPKTVVSFLPEQSETHVGPRNDSHKQIRVYNSHYDENTDESPIDSDKNHPTSSDKTINEFSVVVPRPKKVETTAKTKPSCSLPESCHVSKISAFMPNSPQVNRRSSQPASRTYYTIDSESHKYHSLESDLDSINDFNDPRCLTPDMDWSYLSLMGNASNKVTERSSKHVYQTIGSPVFERKKTKFMYNITKSISFQTSPEVVSKLICVENLNFASITPDTDTSGEGNRLSSIESSMVSGMEELNGSTVLNHVFCSEVSGSNCDEYCGYYEAIVDAVLENVSGYSSLEEACYAFENKSEILEETYICFDGDFFEDEWDVGLKPASDYYIEDEDEIDFSLSFTPETKITTPEKYSYDSLHKFESTTPRTNDASSPKVMVGATPMTYLSPIFKGNKRKLSPPDKRKLLHSEREALVRYDDVNTTHKDRHSEENRISPLTVRTDIETKLSFWDHPGRQRFTHEFDNSSTSSDEGSVEAMASGSSNMSFGSVDVALSPPICEVCTSIECNGEHGSTQITNATPHECGSNDEPVVSEISNDEKVNETDHKTGPVESNRSAFKDVSCVCDYQTPSVTVNKESLQNLRKNSLSSNNEYDARCGSSLDDPIAYNRNVNTWTAFAMVHVPADEISDSASDIINENSVNNSMTSSYLDADNSAIAQINQGFVDA